MPWHGILCKPTSHATHAVARTPPGQAASISTTGARGQQQANVKSSHLMITVLTSINRLYIDYIDLQILQNHSWNPRKTIRILS